MSRVLASLAVVLLAGCATDKVTLLENEDGHPNGAVAVIDEKRGSEVLVDKALTEAKLRGRPVPRTVGKLKPAYSALLGSLPPAAREFGITFGLDEVRIPAAQRTVLEAIRTELSIRPGAQIEVVGFTDSSGSDEYNDEVSKKRAEAVAAELREFGFPVDLDDAVGRGEREAKASLGDGVMDASYRRVVVVVR